MKALYALLIIAALSACNQSGNTGTDSKNKDNTEITALKKIQVNIEGMSCEGCENTIESALAKLDGVYEAEALHKEGIATITFDSTKVDTQIISQTIDNLGYEVIH